jgi:hypothetical protein
MEYRRVELPNGKYQLDVYDTVKVGSIQDICCGTNLKLNGLNAIRVEYKPGSGYLAINEKVEELKLFFEYAYGSESLKSYLKKRGITVLKNQLGNTITLQLFER